MGETFTHIIQVFKWLKVKGEGKNLELLSASTRPRRRTYTRSGEADKMSKREKCVAFPGKEGGSIWKWGSRSRNWEVCQERREVRSENWQVGSEAWEVRSKNSEV